MTDDLINLRLDSLLEETVNLDKTTLRQIRAAWDEIDEADRIAAWGRVKEFLERTRRETQMDETRERVRKWVSALPSGAPLWNLFSGLSRQRHDTMAARLGAAPAVLDAAAVVIVGEFLDDHDTTLLEGPFRERQP